MQACWVRLYCKFLHCISSAAQLAKIVQDENMKKTVLIIGQNVAKIMLQVYFNLNNICFLKHIAILLKIIDSIT